MKHTAFLLHFIVFYILTFVAVTHGISVENGVNNIYSNINSDIVKNFNHAQRGNILDFREGGPKRDLSLADDDGDFDLTEVIALSQSKVNEDTDAYSHAEKMIMVDLHNVYRSNLTRPIPKGSDVMYMEWNDTLAQVAKDWLKDCQTQPGHGANATEVQGQNVFQGSSMHPSRPVWMWYQEYQNYFFSNFTCSSKRQCGHMLQVLWHDSAQIGCARKSSCFPRESASRLVNCYYLQPGNVKATGVQVFKYGWQCTRCEQPDGNICYHGLCIKKQTCKAKGLDCECKLACKNCAKPNHKACRCEACKLGWDWPDCSFPCGNAIDEARKKAGFCRWKSKTVGGKFCENRYVQAACRMECGLCKPLNLTSKDELCCKGKLCPPHHVLDKSCNCKVDCPSNLCLYPPSTTTKVPFVRKTNIHKNVKDSKTKVKTKRPKSKKVEVSGSSQRVSYLPLWLLLTFSLFFG